MDEIELSDDNDDDNEENNNNNNNINKTDNKNDNKISNIATSKRGIISEKPLKNNYISNDIKNNISDKKKSYKSKKSETDKSNGNDNFKINNKGLKEKWIKIIYILTSINLEQDLLSLYNALIIYILSVHNFILL